MVVPTWLSVLLLIAYAAWPAWVLPLCVWLDERDGMRRRARREASDRARAQQWADAWAVRGTQNVLPPRPTRRKKAGFW